MIDPHASIERIIQNSVVEPIYFGSNQLGIVSG